MEKSFGHIDDSHLGIRTNYHHMLVEKNPGITNDLPEQFAASDVSALAGFEPCRDSQLADSRIDFSGSPTNRPLARKLGIYTDV